MKSSLAIALILSIISFGYSQSQEYKVYRNLKKAMKNKEKVEALTLYGEKLGEIPDEVFELKNLKILNLTNNQIEVIPDKIIELSQLERLILMKNEIKELPESLSKLNKLEKLNVAYNGLSEAKVEELRKLMPECEIISFIKL